MAAHKQKQSTEHVEHSEHKLNQFFATSICGNDILSSALYVSSVAIIFTGVYAPLILLMICLVLFFYKSVYTEVVEALPVNGGAYNCLLNATAKPIAATAGVMTILSYVATACISGSDGIDYIKSLFPMVPAIPATIVGLFAFAMLVIAGIKDSAKVALGIFAFHIAILTIFLILGAYYAFHGHSYYLQNLQYTLHTILAEPKGILSMKGLLPTIVLGFSASLLGVSGFESSANFVEEQGKGVFRKTLRNMLIGVAIFNPLIALVALNAMPFHAITASQDFLLADAANILGGIVFKYAIAIDAFLVLWGAVLTAFVGVSGLIYRMSADGCLPQFLTKQNSKGSFPIIVLSFFALCSSILIVTKGNLLSLAGVYTIAFLGVMSSFAFGNLLMKETRTDLKRTYNAPRLFVIFAFFSTFIGIIGNIIIDPTNLLYFSMYFIPAILIAYGVIYEDQIMKALLRMSKPFPAVHNFINHQFTDLVKGEFVAFVWNAHRLAKILDYINRNETGRNVTLVVCSSGEKKEYDKHFQEIKETLPYIKKAGMFPNLNVSLLYKNEPFGPEVIHKIETELNIRKNRMLIGSIHPHHPYEYSDLGGVRIIF